MSRWAVLLISLFASSNVSAKENMDTRKILIIADKSRGRVDTSLEYTIKVDCSGSEGTKGIQRTFKVRSWDKDATATTLEPPERQGEIVLMNDRSIWQITPTSKRPISISASERTGGLAAVGDILATSFAEAYEGTIAKEETISGELAYRIELTAKDNKTSYPSAVSWVGKKSGLTIKAEFLSPSKKKVKTVEFTYMHSVSVNGAKIPFISGSTLTDEIGTRSTCLMTYEVPRNVETRPAEFDLRVIMESR